MVGESLESEVVLKKLQQGPVLLVYSFMPALQGRQADPDEPVLEDPLSEPMFEEEEEEDVVNFVSVLQIGEARDCGEGMIGLGEMYLDELCELVPMVGSTPIRRLSLTMKRDSCGKHAVILIGNLGLVDDHDRFYRTVDRELPLSHFERELRSAQAGTPALLNKIVELCIQASNPQDLGQIDDQPKLSLVHGPDASNREDTEDDTDVITTYRGPRRWFEQMVDNVTNWWWSEHKIDDDSEDSQLEVA